MNHEWEVTTGDGRDEHSGQSEGRVQKPVGRNLKVTRDWKKARRARAKRVRERAVRGKPREERLGQVMQALSSTFQGLYSKSHRSCQKILSRGLT